MGFDVTRGPDLTLAAAWRKRSLVRESDLEGLAKTFAAVLMTAWYLDHVVSVDILAADQAGDTDGLFLLLPIPTTGSPGAALLGWN